MGGTYGFGSVAIVNWGACVGARAYDGMGEGGMDRRWMGTGMLGRRIEPRRGSRADVGGVVNACSDSGRMVWDVCLSGGKLVERKAVMATTKRPRSTTAWVTASRGKGGIVERDVRTGVVAVGGGAEVAGGAVVVGGGPDIADTKLI